MQSGSDRILEAMNRRHTRADYLARRSSGCARARPDIALSSDFIVGFPGETEDDFRDTLRLVDEVGFASAYSFKYSPRPGTPAADMDAVAGGREGRAPAAPAGRRSSGTRRAFNGALRRQDLRRAVREARPPSRARSSAARPISSRCRSMAPASLIGEIAPVTITEVGTNSLFGDARECAAKRADRRRCAEGSRSLMALRPLGPGQGLGRPPRRRRRPQVVLAFDDNRHASVLFGQYGQNLALIERRLGVVAEQRGNHVTLEGSRDARRAGPPRAGKPLRAASSAARTSRSGDVEGAIRLAIAQGSLFDFDPAATRSDFEQINLRKRPVRARTTAQDAYIRALRRHALVFGTGPAGTGKTWLAVAHAVALFERKEVDRIILSRPAVEAGERLGFLPGDLREKVDPYLRPIYDALHDLMDARIVERAMQTNEIEIAPLAFMRGRTLSNAVVILDEAQNTTAMQMKMFLTRLGREQPHDRHRRSEPGRPAARADVGPGRSDAAARRRRGHRPRGVHRRGRDSPRAGGADRRGLRQGRRGAPARGQRRTRNEPNPPPRPSPAKRRAGRSQSESTSLSARRAGAGEPTAKTIVKKAVLAAAEAVSTPPTELAIVLTDDSAIQTLNRDWRGKNAPTNVLSFPAPAPGKEPVRAPIYRRHRHRLSDRRARGGRRGQAVQPSSRASCRPWISPSAGL